MRGAHGWIAGAGLTGGHRSSYLVGSNHRPKGRVMRLQSRNFLGSMFSALTGALAVAAAVDRGRRPSDEDLRALGIDPAEFRNIRRYY